MLSIVSPTSLVFAQKQKTGKVVKKKKIRKYKKKTISSAKKKPFEFSLGVGLTSLYTPSFGASLTAKGFGHYALTMDIGSGSFDTSSFADEKSAATVDHSYLGFGGFFYPSSKGSFYYGAIYSIEKFSVASIAHSEVTDFDAGTQTEFEVNQTTTISSSFLTPAFGFYNKFSDYFYTDSRFGLSIALSSSTDFSASRQDAPLLDDDAFNETTQTEKADVEKFFGSIIPYLSLTIGGRVEF